MNSASFLFSDISLLYAIIESIGDEIEKEKSILYVFFSRKILCVGGCTRVTNQTNPNPIQIVIKLMVSILNLVLLRKLK